MEIKNVGVVGCGLMGRGIAQLCAQSGYQVVVSEANDERLNEGLTSISDRLAREVEKERLSAQDRDATLGRLKGTTNTGDFCVCDLVVEAVVELLEEVVIRDAGEGHQGDHERAVTEYPVPEASAGPEPGP